MSKGGPFNFVGGVRPKRFFYNLSHFKLFDCDLGELVPCLALETVSGDKFKISNSIVIRTQPLISPILQDIKVYTEYFFVPYRILWQDFDKFLTGGKDGDFSSSVPLWNDVKETSGSVDRIFAKHSLADKFGLPIGAEIPFDDFPTFFLQAAYNRIFNEFYRDETLDDEVSEFNNTVLRRRWKKDYFTSALPFQQRGDAAGFRFTFGGSDFLPVVYGGVDPDVTTDPDDLFANFRSSPGRLYTDDSRFGFSTVTNESGGLGPTSYLNHHVKGRTVGSFINVNPQYSDITASNTRFVPYGIDGSDLSLKINGKNNIIDIADLRLSFQIQKFLERNARAGYRFNEFLLAHFGLSPRDSVLQRPEYIGGSRSQLLVSEVLQTSETTDSSPQGNLSGRGLCVTGGYISTYTCSEPGVIIGLFSCMPSNLYDSQGIHKMFTRKDRYDFYFPEFSHLSEQPIKNRELFVSSSHDTNDGTFGFQPIYQEFRHMRNFVTGEFRPAVNGLYKEYSFARSFVTNPTLSGDFIESNPDSSRIFAVNSINPLLVNFGNIVKSVRPITRYSDPGLVDHF